MNIVDRATGADSDVLREQVWSVPSAWVPPSCPELPDRADAVVVGGGIIGVASAYWLARGGASVTLLEAKHLGAGASGRNAGLFLPAAIPLEDTSIIDEVLRENLLDVEMRKHGHLALAESGDLWDRFREESNRRPKSAPAIDLLDRARCERIARSRLPESVLGGRWYAGGRSVNPWKLLLGLARAAAAHGCHIVAPCRVEGFDPRRRSVSVRTEKGAIETARLLVACGAATSRLVPILNRVSHVRPGQMLASAAFNDASDSPGLALGFGRLFWRRLADGRVVAGGLADLDRDKVEPDDVAVNRSVLDAVADSLGRLMPDWSLFPIVHRWASVFDESIDGKPIVGALPGVENVWVASGFGGHGLPPALGIGKALAVEMGFGPAGAPEIPPSHRIARLGSK